jgi:acyl transferase domain-containing protein
MATRLANWLEARPALVLPGVARTLMMGRAPFDHRLALVASSCGDVVAQLRRFPEGEVLRRRIVEHEPRIGFWFACDALPGRCEQALPANAPLFRDKIRECDALLSAEAGVSLTDWLNGNSAAVPEEIWPAFSVAVQVALAGLLQSCGVEPAVAAGRGMGAITAAWCAGVLRVEDALRLALAVGRGDARAVEALSQLVPMSAPRRPWFTDEEESLLRPWTRRALAMGAAVRRSDAQAEDVRAWVVIGLCADRGGALPARLHARPEPAIRAGGRAHGRVAHIRL